MGAWLIKEAASKTNNDAGDGTTTLAILAYAIVSKGLRNITAGANLMILKRGIEKWLISSGDTQCFGSKSSWIWGPKKRNV